MRCERSAVGGQKGRIADPRVMARHPFTRSYCPTLPASLVRSPTKRHLGGTIPARHVVFRRTWSFVLELKSARTRFSTPCLRSLSKKTLCPTGFAHRAPGKTAGRCGSFVSRTGPWPCSASTLSIAGRSPKRSARRCGWRSMIGSSRDSCGFLLHSPQRGHVQVAPECPILTRPRHHRRGQVG